MVDTMTLDRSTSALRLALEVICTDLRSCIELSCTAEDGSETVSADTPPAEGTLCESMVDHVTNQLIAIRQIMDVLDSPWVPGSQPEWLGRVIAGEIEI